MKSSQKNLLKLERLAIHGQMLMLDQVPFYSIMVSKNKIIILFYSVFQEPLVLPQLKYGAELLDFQSKDQTPSLSNISSKKPRDNEVFRNKCNFYKDMWRCNKNYKFFLAL
jgi:hypothetical protein